MIERLWVRIPPGDGPYSLYIVSVRVTEWDPSKMHPSSWAMVISSPRFRILQAKLGDGILIGPELNKNYAGNVLDSAIAYGEDRNLLELPVVIV